MEAGAFDYEHRVFGRAPVRASDRSFAAVRVGHLLPGLPARGRVLEWGCGAGRMLGAVAAARPDLELVGMDVSHAAVEEGARACPEAELRVCPAEGPLPAADGEFDAVFVLDALEHVEDPAGVLAELRRVLAPGGRLHLNVPCEGDPLALWRWLPPPARFWKRDLGGHVQRFRRLDVTALLTAAGFAVERTRYSLQVLGNFADVATFAALAWQRRRHPDRPLTTADVLEKSQADHARPLARLQAAVVRAADLALWLEARLLARVPSWCVHLDARRVERPGVDEPRHAAARLAG
jgi:SAM-dependent methyltransferase